MTRPALAGRAGSGLQSLTEAATVTECRARLSESSKSSLRFAGIVPVTAECQVQFRRVGRARPAAPGFSAASGPADGRIAATAVAGPAAARPPISELAVD